MLVAMRSTVYSCSILVKREFSQHTFKSTQISNFMKIRPVRAELLRIDGRKGGRTDRRTDMTKLIAAFRYFANAPKNQDIEHERIYEARQHEKIRAPSVRFI